MIVATESNQFGIELKKQVQHEVHFTAQSVRCAGDFQSREISGYKRGKIDQKLNFLLFEYFNFEFSVIFSDFQ